MAFSLSVHHSKAFLLIVATGHAEVCDYVGTMDLASTVSRMCSYRRLAFDLVSVDLHFTREEHVVVGKHAAKVLSQLERVAVVINPAQRVGFGEMAAKGGGLGLQTFIDLREATDWISS